MHPSHPPRINGRYFLGGPADPPQPMGVAMADRVDGNIYFITHTAGTLGTALRPARWKFPTYDAHAGPYLDTDAGQIRLYMSSGTLTYEAVPVVRAQPVVANGPIHAVLDGYNADIYRITTPGGFEIGDALQLTKVN